MKAVLNGLAWTTVWTNQRLGEGTVNMNLIDGINGAYEVLVGVALMGSRNPEDALLKTIEFRTRTMLNSKTLPRLLLGRNTVYVGTGEQTDSTVIQPDLQGDRYKAYIVEERNIATKAEHPGYQGVMFAQRPNEDAYVVFRIDAPASIERISYGGRFYNRAPESRIDMLHSFDNGATWQNSYRLTKTEPIEVSFNWSEVQEDYSFVERSHTQLVTETPFKYTINVGGADHPVVNRLRVNPKEAVDNVKYGYSDGIDVGGARYVPQWVSYGRNLAQGKSYKVSVPSKTSWGAGDPQGTKLTDGVIGPPYAGGIGPGYALCWDKGDDPVIEVDFGQKQRCGAFRIHLSAGWPWWDAMNGQVKDKVEVLTSLDGRTFESRGFFALNLRWKDIPINHMMPDDETATGFTYDLVPREAVQARYVKFKITAQRTLTVSEVQVLDSVKYKPFDLLVALPDESSGSVL